MHRFKIYLKKFLFFLTKLDYKMLFSKYCRAKGTDANEGLFKKQADIMMIFPLLIGSTIDPCQILLILFRNYRLASWVG